MGLSTSKTKSTVDNRTTESGTTTPIVPDWVSSTLQDYTRKVTDLGATDPAKFVAQPAVLQKQAFDLAGKLGAVRPGYDDAMTMAKAAAAAPANLAAGVQLGNASGWSAPGLAPAANAAAQGYTASQARSQGYNPALAEAAKLAAVQQGQATTTQAHSILDQGGIQKYVDPNLDALVNSTLADFDADAGKQKAAQAASAAKNKALGGSRYGLQEAATTGELARARLAAEAQLKSNAYNFGAGLAQFDTANKQANEIANADRHTNVSLQNAGMANQHSQAAANLLQQANLANQEAKNQSAALAANAANQASLFNAGATNEANAALAAAKNQASLFNTGQANQFALSQAQLQADAAKDAAAAKNQFALQQGMLDFQKNQFNASQQDAALGRQLQGAGLVGNLAGSQAANQRDDLSTLLGAGAQQYAIDDAMAKARLAQLQAQAQLLGTVPFNMFAGQNVNSSGTVKGTTTTTQTPSLFNQLLAGASLLPLPFPKPGA